MDSAATPPPKGEKREVVLAMPEQDPKSSSSLTPDNGSYPASKSFDFPPPKPLHTTFSNSPSPDRAKRLTPTSNWPPRPPSDTLKRRRSLARSVYSKPKSRFVEQPQPASTSVVEEHDHTNTLTTPQSSPRPVSQSSPGRAGKTAGTPTTFTTAGEDEEEEIIHEYIPTREKLRRKLKFWVVLEWVALFSVTGFLSASLTVRRLQHHVIWGLEIWKWCLMLMVIFCGRLVTAWLIKFLVFIIELNFVLKNKVLYFVYGIKRSVQVCIWGGLVILTWNLLFDRGAERSEKTRKFLDYFSRTLATVMIGSVLWLVKTLLVKLLASSFHVSTFFDRIQESIFHQYILQTLSGPPLMEMAEMIGSSRTASSTRSRVQVSFRNAKTGKKGEEQAFIDMAKLQKVNQEKISALTMKKLVSTITTTGLWTISHAVDESVYEDVTEQKDEEITSEMEAKAAAYGIFKNVAKHGSKYIEEEDLLRFLTQEELESVLPQFEGAVETRKIKKSVMRKWVVKVYLERKSLAHSLNDTKTAIRQLSKLASGVVIIVVLVIWLLLMQFATTKILVFISSQILVLVFMFGNTIKTIFEAIIFVFVTHPFDVGDRCVIDGVQMIVEEMNILTTVLLKGNNEKIYYPNAVLAVKPISNLYRSPFMGDSVEFCIDVYTPIDAIKALKDRIKRYIDSKPHHWRASYSVVVKEIENMNKMKMVLYVNHTMNFQDIAKRNNRRTDLIFELKKIFEDLQIKYNLKPQKVHLTHVANQTFP